MPLPKNVTLRQAYANIFINTSACLNTGLVLYSSNIVMEATSSQYPIALFTDLRGDVNRALGICFKLARSQEGDGSHDDI